MIDQTNYLSLVNKTIKENKEGIKEMDVDFEENSDTYRLFLGDKSTQTVFLLMYNTEFGGEFDRMKLSNLIKKSGANHYAEFDDDEDAE